MRTILRGRRGFTKVELLVVVFVIGLLIAMFLPLLNKTKCSSCRVKCASNLRQIGQGLLLYANDHKGAYPRTHYVPDAPLLAFTGAAARNPFLPDGPAANDVTAAMFLLVRHADLNPEVFICTSTSGTTDNLAGLPATSRSNFSGAKHLGYSVTIPYPSGAAEAAGYKFDSSVVAEFALVADMNPGTAQGQDVYKNLSAVAPMKELKLMNTLNHEQVGQNVMFNDGHVEWFTTPFCGANQDHVYTAQGKTSGSPMTHQPAAPLDSVLVPTD